MSNQDDNQPKARWGLVALVTALGALVIGVPFALTKWVNPEFGTPQSLGSTALINVGTTLLLAALLVWLGRSFVSHAEGAARRVVEERTEEFRQETEDIRQRLEALQGRVDERTASAEAAGAAVADDIVTDVSYETVTRALELANDVEALWHSAITVPTNDSIDAPAVRLSWTAAHHGGRFDDLDNLIATLEVDYEHHPESSTRRFDQEWLPGVPADEMLHELKESMIRADYGEAAQALDARYMFERFGHGISDAIAGKRAQADAWLKGCGALHELVGADLAVTSLGVAARGHGLAFKSSEFPQRPPPVVSAEQLTNRKLYRLPTPPVPDGIDPEHWTVAIARAAEHHPPVRRPGIPDFGGYGIPVTSANSPVPRD
ncbi:hypothetical protein GCM10023216_02730 [Isoptericola chiayiensis]|uniref:Uncharacterized protein n=1 Tax=Isoptericola chiayiensis TaxID=579446 RepID=A0ABP8XYK0_9MICO|nr:hypothetical protein [Isoptericola chiayiensis]NOW01091.1 hypothetical protein [Isoptericola chiayiensis]